MALSVRKLCQNGDHSSHGCADDDSYGIVVTVGETQDWLPELVERAKALKVGNGFDPSVDM